MAIVKTDMTLVLRRFPVRLVDKQTGAEVEDTVTLEKSHLQAAHLVGESSEELLKRICTRQGYTVLDIGTPDRLSVTVDLDELASGQTGKREAMTK